MFEIVETLLIQFIDMFPYIIALDLIFYFIGQLLFGGGVK